MSKSKIYDLTKEELQNLFDTSYSYADILRKIGLFGSCNNRTLKRIEKEYNINVDQFSINHKRFMSEIGKRSAKRYDLESKLTKNSIINSHKLKNKLIEAGYKKAECEICGLSTWLDKPIKLHLHHKDGDHTNNTLENLQILCPNCHSMTDNYGVYNSNIYKKHIADKENKKTTKIKYKITNTTKQTKKKKTPQKKELCPVCKTNMKDVHSSTCLSCSYKSRMKDLSEIVERDILKDLIRNTPFLQIAKKYDVSDNTIRKWCKKYDLPFKSKEIKSYSDEEWVLI